MNTASRNLLALLSLLLALSGCVSPQSRIEKSPEAFNALPDDQKALIRQGKVGIGFNETAVKLALGEPNRITQRTDTAGKSTVWRYTQYEDQYGTALYTGFYHRGFGAPYGGFYSPFYGPYPYYLDSGSRRERDHLRVVFADGKVNAIEEEVK